ncbi:MAG: GT-D fold domain-containing glycosyltransferase [Bacillota bacterium]|nr:GT-D fold domain-containing glycosyltransferase [Bacillota bacterium]MDW7684421.1 GT-D fold domain-containing glycosyltransferase [Bacillota bacterium]
MKPTKLSSGELMDMILRALDRQLPLAVVSLGASESFVLAQETVLPYREFMRHAEACVANMGLRRGQQHRGVRFPNLEARDVLAEALRRTNIIGYNLIIRDKHSGLLTEKVLDYYNLWPEYTFEAYIRRVIMFSQKEKFENMLRGKRILLICGYADEVKKAMNKNLQEKLGFTIAGTVKIHEYEDIPRAKKEIMAIDFDVALLAAGLNAIILAVFIAERTGKVAFDIGQGMESLITGEIQDAQGFISQAIGIVRLLDI